MDSVFAVCACEVRVDAAPSAAHPPRSLGAARCSRRHTLLALHLVQAAWLLSVLGYAALLLPALLLPGLEAPAYEHESPKYESRAGRPSGGCYGAARGLPGGCQGEGGPASCAFSSGVSLYLPLERGASHCLSERTQRRPSALLYASSRLSPHVEPRLLET